MSKKSIKCLASPEKKRRKDASKEFCSRGAMWKAQEERRQNCEGAVQAKKIAPVKGRRAIRQRYRNVVSCDRPSFREKTCPK